MHKTAHFTRLGAIYPPILYVCASAALFLHHRPEGDVFSPSGDPFAFIWFFYWWPYALIHGLNPFVSHFAWNPVGVNMTWATSTPTLAIVGAPLTLLWSPTATWNFFTFIAPAANAYAAYRLFVYLLKSRPPAALGGLLYGFSNYVLAQDLAHINLSLTALVPIIILLVIRRATLDIKRPWYVAAMVLCATLQFGISSEILATAATFGALAYVIFFPFYKQQADFKGLAADTAVSALLTLALLSPFLFYMYRGVQQVPHLIADTTAYSADLLNYIIPTPINYFGKNVFSSISKSFTGNLSEQGAYIGAPLLLIALFSLRDAWPLRWGRPLLLVTAIIVVCSLGPSLWVNGVNTHIPLPWRALGQAPLLRHALPTRFTMYMALIVALLVAWWLASATSSRQRLLRYTASFAASALLVPNPAFFAYRNVETPIFFSKANLDTLAPRPLNLVVLPYGILGSSMLWQVRSHMAFKMAGGYLGFVPKYFEQFPATNYFYGNNLPADAQIFRNDLADFCNTNHVEGIVVTPGTDAHLRDLLRELGWPRSQFGSAIFYKTPPSDQLSFTAIHGDYWGGAQEGLAWIGKHVAIQNHTPIAKSLLIERASAPSSVGDIIITITQGGKQTTYTITNNQIHLILPRFSNTEIASNKTWIPAQISHTGDTRALSVSITLSK